MMPHIRRTIVFRFRPGASPLSPVLVEVDFCDSHFRKGGRRRRRRRRSSSGVDPESITVIIEASTDKSSRRSMRRISRSVARVRLIRFSRECQGLARVNRGLHAVYALC